MSGILFAGTVDQYFAELERDRAERAALASRPDEFCPHGVSLYSSTVCRPCGVEAGEVTS